MSGLASSARSASICACENTTSPAALAHDCVMRQSSASEASAEACGTPALRCSATGRNGFGRGDCGQASSVRPVTQSASKSSPTDSRRPSTCTGASPDSAWKTVSRQNWRRWRLAASPVRLDATTPSEPRRARTSCHFTSAWCSAESRPRSPGKPAAARHAAKCAAQAWGGADRPGGGTAATAARRRNESRAARCPPASCLLRDGCDLACASPRGPAGVARSAAAPRRAARAAPAPPPLRRERASATRGSPARTAPAPRRGRAAPGRRRRWGTPPGRLPSEMLNSGARGSPAGGREDAREDTPDQLAALRDVRHDHGDARLAFRRRSLETRARPARGQFEFPPWRFHGHDAGSDCRGSAAAPRPRQFPRRGRRRARIAAPA